MKVEVVMACAGVVLRKAINLPLGALIADAVSDAGLAVPAGGAVGVWGRLRALDEPVVEGDRVEIYEQLEADPKQARRSRARLRRLS